MTNNILHFPKQPTAYTLDTRQLKRISGQTELKEIVSGMSCDEVETLKEVIFGPWPILRELCETSAYTFTRYYPGQATDTGLVQEAIVLGINAYKRTNRSALYSKPMAFIEAMMSHLDSSTDWQVVGAQLDGTRKTAWKNMVMPIPSWMKKNDFQKIEFTRFQNDKKWKGRWLYLACRLLPVYGDEMLGSLLEKQLGAGCSNG